MSRLMFWVLTLLALIAGLAVAAILVPWLLFAAPDHSQFDRPRPEPFSIKPQSAEHAQLVSELRAGMANPPATGPALMQIMRRELDARGAAMAIRSTIKPVHAQSAAGLLVEGEWVIPAGADGTRRLLYLHGGGYVMGSALSHRRITDRLAHLAEAAVLAVNYRLMPEHPRLAGIEDAFNAYSWMLQHGPDGESTAQVVVVAGDSAGGNLALATIAHARDAGWRAPDAVVVMAPQTDATYASPSLLSNIDTDVMQGASFGPILRGPKAVQLWVSFVMNRLNPSDPRVSPLLGNLDALPPTLIQVSAAEMFLDDAVRYANKAHSAGSTVVLQTWPDLVHVWHAFDVPEAGEAFAAVGAFLEEHAPR